MTDEQENKLRLEFNTLWESEFLPRIKEMGLEPTQRIIDTIYFLSWHSFKAGKGVV